ncbi:MAG: hypothetical protein EOO96_02020, partial [Pedobacter sp.]
MIKTSATQTKGNLTIITNGFSSDSLAKIDEIKYYTDTSISKDLKSKATLIPDIAYYLAKHPSIETIKIYGYGLSKDELKKLHNYNIAYHPADEPAGILSCNWNNELAENEMLYVQGTYNNPSTKAAQLKLTGFGVALDSLTIPAETSTTFSLKNSLRQRGRAVLNLIATGNNDTVAQEKIPVQVFPKPPLKLLTLTSFPSFEYNFLKKWLYENQYPVAIRSKISKDKYSTDFLNRSTIKLEDIRQSMLQKEEVLIIDQQEFEAISSAERTAIMQAVTQGLGLVLLITEPASSHPL